MECEMRKLGVAQILATFMMIFALGSSGAPPEAVAQSAEARGLQIASKSRDIVRGYGDFTASGRMVLRAAGGAESVRDFDFKTLEVGSNSHSILVFNWPGDIRDTGLLTIEQQGASDQQWLYLPADRRVRRIAGSGRSGSFVGSEFAYEDMVEQNVDNFHHRWIRDEGCCHLVERRPREASGYARQVVWYDRNRSTIERIDYFNRGDAHFKTLTVSGWRQYAGGVWRPTTMRMVNHLTRKETDLVWRDYQFRVGLRPDAFTPRALERGR